MPSFRPPSILKRLLKSLLRIILVTTLFCVFAVVIPLLYFQSKLIYHPRPYS